MIRLFFILCLSISIAFADSGDTTTVQVHENVDMTWYGHYKNWGEWYGKCKQTKTEDLCIGQWHNENG